MTETELQASASHQTLLAAVAAAATPAAAAAPSADVAPAPAVGVSLADHNAAVAQARAEGERAGKAAGALEERTRVAAILGHENAKGREALANKLAFETGMSADDAGKFMADLPTASAQPSGRLDRAMAATANAPKPVADSPAPQRQAVVIDTAAIYASRAEAHKRVG